MHILAGTSGFAYAEWKGVFYPKDLPASGQLHFYGGRLPAVEINNTWYRTPRRETVAAWASQVPDGFRFALKANRRLTHTRRLKDPGDDLAYFHGASLELGPKLGAVLFQLPPSLRKDLPRLQDFLTALPDGWPAAFEFRHPSWRDDAVLEALRTRNAALCLAEDDDGTPEPVATADWGYVRLRRTEYDDPRLHLWADRIRSQPWTTAYVFFKHETTAPASARRFLDLTAP